MIFRMRARYSHELISFNLSDERLSFMLVWVKFRQIVSRHLVLGDSD